MTLLQAVLPDAPPASRRAGAPERPSSAPAPQRTFNQVVTDDDAPTLTTEQAATTASVAPVAKPGAPGASGRHPFFSLAKHIPADVVLANPARTGIAFSITNVVLYSVLALAQWVGWGGLVTAHGIGIVQALSEALIITAVNLVFGLATIAGVFLLHPSKQPTRRRFGLIALVAALTALPRAVLLTWIYSTPSHHTYLGAEWLAGLITGFVAVSAGVLGAQLLRNIQGERAERLVAMEKAAHAVDELQVEEIRVRRMVSDQLHGNLQFRLLTVTAAMDSLVGTLEAAGHTQCADNLRNTAETLEEIRETEVRNLSHAVFPAGVELGLSRAVECMLKRLPTQIDAAFQPGPGYRQFIDTFGVKMPLAERLVAAYAIEEAVTNALKHGHATRVVVNAEISPAPGTDGTAWLLDVAVVNNGLPVSAGSMVNLNGLARHADRIAARGGSLALTTLPDDAGVEFRMQMPFQLDVEQGR